MDRTICIHTWEAILGIDKGSTSTSRDIRFVHDGLEETEDEMGGSLSYRETARSWTKAR